MIDSQRWSDGERAMSGSLLPAFESSRWYPTARPPGRAGDARSASLQRAAIAETRRHARRLAVLATSLGRHINLSEAELGVLRLGSLLHDIGKHALPAQVLFKSGRLTSEEFAAVKCHPLIGDLLCARVPVLQPVRPIVRHHHERLDGSGYPDRLRGARVPLLAQLVGIVDVYDALVCTRPYKPAYDCAHALDILRREVDLGWRRPDLVAAFIEVIEFGEAAEPLVAAAAV